MTLPAIRFDDGAAYETFMGTWSRLAGDVFLDWLDPPPGRRWLDVGCGNGAFTALLIERCVPVSCDGIDPSAEQLAYARTRLASDTVRFRLGDATSLTGEAAAFDAAVLALVLYFLPDPPRDLAAVARAVRPGGSVSAYAWDVHGGGLPLEAVQDEMTRLGVPPPWPPSIDASRREAMQTLWTDAGLVDVQTRTIAVQRTFADFDAYWSIARTGPRILPALARMSAADIVLLERRLRARMPAAADGSVTCSASANAVRGCVPA